MAKVKVLLELAQQTSNSFETFELNCQSEAESVKESEKMLTDMSGLGIEVTGEFAPIPMYEGKTYTKALSEFSVATTNSDMESSSIVIPCQFDYKHYDEIQNRKDVKIWPNSPLTLFDNGQPSEHILDLANSALGLDCRPFREGVSIDDIRTLLSVESIWNEGFRGQNIVIGIVDEGVNSEVYPVVGGFSRAGASRQPGDAPITSHGSMCAADVLVAAPACKIYDYPFLGVQNSGGAMAKFQAILNQRRIDGTPHITNNSYGFVGKPDKQLSPRHEVWDINHPIHRKVRELVSAGIHMFFAAGNCGQECPSGSCLPSGIGPGNSIHASNSLEEVITVAAVNSRHERIGYSSQGPGGFFNEKPDIAAYSHFFGNFGPERPGGTSQPYDNGTSASTPVAAGVAALLLSSFPNLSPKDLKDVLIQGAINLGSPGWDANTGYGVINAGSAYRSLCREL
ncbi:S8 family peptidase [Flagellimonas sp. S174]|uniref:S8 family peptidase n=1 Tax=Flagellimonas sp. S174 TaxID=3410790 RepID=UPI003BF4A5CF